MAFVTTDTYRLFRLLDWVEKTLSTVRAEDDADYFLLASFDPATADPEEVFNTPFWRQPFSSELQVMVGYST